MPLVGGPEVALDRCVKDDQFENLNIYSLKQNAVVAFLGVGCGCIDGLTLTINSSYKFSSK